MTHFHFTLLGSKRFSRLTVAQSSQPRLQQFLTPRFLLLLFLVLQLSFSDGLELWFRCRELPLPTLQPPALLLSVSLVGSPRQPVEHGVRLGLLVHTNGSELLQKGCVQLRNVLPLKCNLQLNFRASWFYATSSLQLTVCYQHHVCLYIDFFQSLRP